MLGYLSADINCLFRDATSFPRAQLEENCELRGTDNVQGQISEHIILVGYNHLISNKREWNNCFIKKPQYIEN